MIFPDCILWMLAQNSRKSSTPPIKKVYQPTCSTRERNVLQRFLLWIWVTGTPWPRVKLLLMQRRKSSAGTVTEHLPLGFLSSEGLAPICSRRRCPGLRWLCRSRSVLCAQAWACQRSMRHRPCAPSRNGAGARVWPSSVEVAALSSRWRSRLPSGHLQGRRKAVSAVIIQRATFSHSLSVALARSNKNKSTGADWSVSEDQRINNWRHDTKTTRCQLAGDETQQTEIPALGLRRHNSSAPR